MMTADKIKDSLLPVFEKYCDKVVFAYLFGSIVKGNISQLSDVDIAVFLQDKYREAFFDIRLSLYADICRALKINDVDIVLLNPAQNLMLLGDIIRSSIVIYDSDPDIREGYEVNILHQSIDFKSQRLAVMGI